jgi:cellulose synthase (UDP-forming)
MSPPRRPARRSRTRPLPARESRARLLGIRFATALALLAGAVYLGWRALETVNLSVWWLAVPLLLLEGHALLGLLLHAAGLWDLHSVTPPAHVEQTDLRLAVLVPTYDEPPEVLLPTIAAAVAVRLPHQTWVLDDGNRPEVATLARELGAHYLARTDRSHAKAGNVNNGLQHISADVIAVLDADHVAHEDLFVRTLGHFDDPCVAFVQTPQDF